MLLAPMLKILLQQYRHNSDLPQCPLFGRCLDKSRHLGGLVARDPRRERDDASTSRPASKGKSRKRLLGVSFSPFLQQRAAGAVASQLRFSPSDSSQMITAVEAERARLGQSRH
jgi:hypothetical protein